MWETFTYFINAPVLAATIRMATPLIFTAMGGIFSERSGIINIGLEGMMLTGAFMGMLVTFFTGNPWVGLVGALLSGGVVGLIHAVAAIRYKVDQVVSGTAINIFAVGFTVFMLRQVFDVAGTSPAVARIHSISIPLVHRIPVVGEIIGMQNPMVYMALVLVVLVHLFLFRTVWGLRLRAVGEHPRAADTVGINVFRTRYLAVVTSGALAGLGGAYLSIAHLSRFGDGMTAGRGFIALAAMIFGKWTPVGALGASLLFGFADAVQIRLQEVGIPRHFVQMVPYILTMVALAGFIGRATPPRSLGKPYEKE